jgi:hypothetical protein
MLHAEVATSVAAARAAVSARIHALLLVCLLVGFIARSHGSCRPAL